MRPVQNRALSGEQRCRCACVLRYADRMHDCAASHCASSRHSPLLPLRPIPHLRQQLLLQRHEQRHKPSLQIAGTQRGRITARNLGAGAVAVALRGCCAMAGGRGGGGESLHSLRRRQQAAPAYGFASGRVKLLLACAQPAGYTGRISRRSSCCASHRKAPPASCESERLPQAAHPTCQLQSQTLRP